MSGHRHYHTKYCRPTGFGKGTNIGKHYSIPILNIDCGFNRYICGFGTKLFVHLMRDVKRINETHNPEILLVNPKLGVGAVVLSTGARIWLSTLCVTSDVSTAPGETPLENTVPLNE